MKIIDLSQKIEENMSQFPGSEKIILEEISKIEEFGYKITSLSCDVHTGTHWDSPSHYIYGGMTIEEMSLDYFMGDAVILDLDIKDEREISKNILNNIEIRPGDILIVRSGFSKYWKTEKYIKNYPYFSKEFSEKLVEKKIKAVGIDFISPDDLESDVAHKILLGNNIPIIENLNNLEEIKVERFFFSAPPINIKDSEAAFTRAFGILE